MARLIGSITLVSVLMLLPSQAGAQSADVRFGVGFNAMLSSSEGLGIGFRARAARVVNNDISLAADAGITGFVLQGRDDASYVFDPQVSMIVTLPPGPTGAGYFLGGVGAFLPFADNGDGDGGPTLHLGLGWVRSLYDTTLFYEVDPQMIIGSESVSIAIPLRVGVIF